MGTVIPEATFLAGLGASPYAAEAALPAFFGEGLLSFGAEKAAESTLPSLIDPNIANGLWDGTGKMAGTLSDMKGLQYIDGVGQNFGAKLSQFGDNLFSGNFLNGNGLKLASAGASLMNGGQQQQPQSTNAQVNSMPRQGMGGMSSFSESAPESQRARLEEEMMKKQQWLQGLGYAGR